MIYTGLHPKQPLTALIHLPVSVKNSIVLLLCIFETSVETVWFMSIKILFCSKNVKMWIFLLCLKISLEVI